MESVRHHDLEATLVTACFKQIAARGWRRLSIFRAAATTDVPFDLVNKIVPSRFKLLLIFGALADSHALRAKSAEGDFRDKLFDLTMRRIDFLQTHRSGVIAIMQALPCDPPAAAVILRATKCSMALLLEAVGIESTGPRGRLHVVGMMGVWAWTIMAWQSDDSPDLTATMAALDEGLRRAERAAGWLG